MEKKISKVSSETNNAYRSINDFISESDKALLDYLYPEHDGEYVPEHCADLLLLRQSLRSLRTACDMAIEKCIRVIPEDEL